MKTCVRVKICGITNLTDALSACELGAWAVGFVFYRQSPRFISSLSARKVIERLPPFITPVGVFVNEKAEKVKAIADICGIKTLQFHGNESTAYCRRFNKFKVIKALRIHPRTNIEIFKNYDVDALLLDTYQEGVFGGTGKSFNWSFALKAKQLGIPLILSGGLNPHNISQAIQRVHPYALDVSSGVEKYPGKKSLTLLKSLFQKI
jgi:phosphoribosylanthranilate isomerase